MDHITCITLSACFHSPSHHHAHPAQLIPEELQEKLQQVVDGLDPKLGGGGSPERPIELIIISLDTPDYQTVIRATGWRMLVLGSDGGVVDC